MPLSVIGAGYGRTGTTSLKVALEHLGFAPCYKWIDAAHSAALWLDAFEHKPVDWEKIFGSAKSCLDFPACLFYQELLVRFPYAKVLLTVRDCNSWFSSAQATYLTSEHLRLLQGLEMGGTSIWPFQEKLLLSAFGNQLDDRGSVIAHYEQHNLEVQRLVPADRLLVYEIDQGWPPLCSFLGVPVPKAPFPNLNSKGEWNQAIRA